MSKYNFKVGDCIKYIGFKDPSLNGRSALPDIGKRGSIIGMKNYDFIYIYLPSSERTQGSLNGQPYTWTTHASRIRLCFAQLQFAFMDEVPSE